LSPNDSRQIAPRCYTRILPTTRPDACSSTRNVAIVGLGKMGILHAGIVNSIPDARVKAICEKDPLLTKLAKKLLPKTIAFYDNHMRMVEEEALDIVFITSPIDTHVPLVVDLARANSKLSLFVEKPLAVYVNEAQAACEAVTNLRGTHMVGFQKRHSPVFRMAKQVVENGSLGDLLFFRSSTFSSDVLRESKTWRFRSGTGGVLLDLASHLLDLLLWLFGEPHSALAVKRRMYSREVDDYVHAVMSFVSGLKGSMDASWSIPSFRLPEVSIEVHGTEGTMTVTDDFVRLERKDESALGSRSVEVHYKQSFDTSVSFLLADSEYTKEDEVFFGSVESRALPETNFFEAAKVNAIIDQITKNAESR
jgi:predicted dehydrogenase